jgi:hypothetical protein
MGAALLCPELAVGIASPLAIGRKCVAKIWKVGMKP